ncbi:hypothetical protein NSMM_370109 [Nitrosomonas mobilis]|uniref:Uncharacterized protein n=1 Tax=Nitrosomonas mobilis TaxID=51642 RepID=A0A1G5SEQ4_9PROT|nr:hypothetical protein NSMM_370109 [Nitrosomonas mobilis]
MGSGGSLSPRDSEATVWFEHIKRIPDAAP